MPTPRRPDYSGQKLAHHDFRNKNVAACSFNHADLRGVNFANANLRYASFVGADCSMCNFAGADLRAVRFKGANLKDAFLRGAWLTGTDFSNADGLLTTVDLLNEHFEWSVGKHSLEVWRTEVSQFSDYWGQLRPGKELRQRVNSDRCSLDGCGVSFATKQMMALKFKPPYWRCEIAFNWLPDVVIPFNTDGRGRCSRLRLMERVERL
jgi:hypothetical protein